MSVAFEPVEVVATDEDNKTPCEICGKPLTERGRTRHMNSAHAGEGVDSTKSRIVGSGKKRKTRVKGLSQEVSEGLASLTGKIIIACTLFWAWYALRRAAVPDPTGEIGEKMAMTDEEDVAIGRPLARFIGSTEQGKVIAPKLVENEDVVEALFATFDWYKRNRQIWDELERGGMYVRRNESTGIMERTVTNDGTNGQVSQRGPIDEDDFGYAYIPPSPQDIIAGG